MRVAFVLFPNLTALDFVGVYDPVTRLKSMGFMPDMEWRLCATTPDITDDRGMRLVPDSIGNDLGAFDLLIVPGGYGTGPLETDADFLGWLRTAAPVPLKASVCTGALLLGAAGWLKGLRATTHASALPGLGNYGARAVDERVVDEGAIVTAGGVAAGLDLGIHLVRRLAGREVAERISRQMEYSPRV